MQTALGVAQAPCTSHTRPVLPLPSQKLSKTQLWHLDSGDARAVVQPAVKAKPCYGGSISFATVVLVVLSSTAAVSNRLGCVRETPLLSSQAHGCPWQADVSSALAQRCFWSCLNNSSLRAHASLSKGVLHGELTARSPHSASRSHGKHVQGLRQLVMLHCKHQAQWINSNAWHRPRCLILLLVSAVLLLGFICTTNPAQVCSKRRNRYCSLAGSAVMHRNER